MYEAHFGLGGSPFHIAPDLHFYVDTGAHRAALAALQAGLARGDEFVALTGDLGAGKTMVARRLLQLVDRERHAVVELAGWRVEGDDLLIRIAAALGMGEIDTALPLGTLMQRLQEVARSDRTALLVIDEAHLLGLDAVRRLAKLTAMRSGSRGVLHVCLVGRCVSPAFDEHARVGRPLQIETPVRLAALDATATGVYIRGRLERVGWKGHPSFASGTVAEIHACTAGNPARINRLCGLLLAQLCERGEDIVRKELVRPVADRLQSEFDDFPEDVRRRWAAPASAGHAPSSMPAPMTPPVPAPDVEHRDPAASKARPAPPMQGIAATAAPLPDIELMLQDVIAEARAEMTYPAPQTPPGLARAATSGPLSRRPRLSRGNSAAARRRVLQAGAALLAFGGGFIGWQRERAPDIGVAGLGQIARLAGQPRPSIEAAAPGSLAPVVAAGLSLDLAPPAAGGRMNPPSPGPPVTGAFAGPDAAGDLGGATVVPARTRPVAAGIADRPRHRLAAHPAGNGADTARAPVATVACSLEAQTMGLCRLAHAHEPSREVAPGAVRTPAPAPVPPPARVACSAAQTALNLCDP